MVFENINLELANQFAKTRWEFDKFQFNYFCDADLHMYSIVYIVDKKGTSAAENQAKDQYP